MVSSILNGMDLLLTHAFDSRHNAERKGIHG